jgi:N-acetylglutamate synthase-like GNAT family acetyltransferase
MLDTFTIREATDDDLAAIDDLVRAHAPQRTPHTDRRGCEPGRNHLLVLDAQGGRLAAAARLDIDAHCGHLSMLVVASDFAGAGIEARMLGVAESLCLAFGVDMIDVLERRAA